MQRIDKMMQMSAGYVFLEGGTGTLSELGLVWEYVAKGLIDPRPIFHRRRFLATDGRAAHRRCARRAASTFTSLKPREQIVAVLQKTVPVS